MSLRSIHPGKCIPTASLYERGKSRPQFPLQFQRTLDHSVRDLIMFSVFTLATLAFLARTRFSRLRWATAWQAPFGLCEATPGQAEWSRAKVAKPAKGMKFEAVRLEAL